MFGVTDVEVIGVTAGNDHNFGKRTAGQRAMHGIAVKKSITFPLIAL